MTPSKINKPLAASKVLVAMPLPEFIRIYYAGNQARFGRSQGVRATQVTKWLNKRAIIVSEELYLPKRPLDVKHEGDEMNRANWRTLTKEPLDTDKAAAAIPILDYIELNYTGSRSVFGRSQGVERQQVTKWLTKRAVVIAEELYLPKRFLDLNHRGDEMNKSKLDNRTLSQSQKGGSMEKKIHSFKNRKSSGISYTGLDVDEVVVFGGIKNIHLLGLFLVALKLAEIIPLSWAWVLVPFWITSAFSIVGLLVIHSLRIALDPFLKKAEAKYVTAR